MIMIVVILMLFLIIVYSHSYFDLMMMYYFWILNSYQCYQLDFPSTCLPKDRLTIRVGVSVIIDGACRFINKDVIHSQHQTQLQENHQDRQTIKGGSVSWNWFPDLILPYFQYANRNLLSFKWLLEFMQEHHSLSLVGANVSNIMGEHPTFRHTFQSEIPRSVLVVYDSLQVGGNAMGSPRRCRHCVEGMKSAPWKGFTLHQHRCGCFAVVCCQSTSCSDWALLIL